MKHFYRDLMTRKVHFTRAPFAGWTARTGLLNVHYAIFQRKSGDLLVPEYLLTKETRAALPDPSAEQEQP